MTKNERDPISASGPSISVCAEPKDSRGQNHPFSATFRHLNWTDEAIRFLPPEKRGWLHRPTREAYDRFRLESPRRLTPEEFDRIRALAADIPSLWNAADTPAADRKEIVRALIERVTVTMPGDAENVVVRIQWIGGTSTEHTLRRPISRYERLTDFPRMRRLVMSMLDESAAGSIW